ncbi:Putative cation/proton antiporter YbaL [BD1-7 clade bacterium]|uniref:Cation/proton antiporter YbaL n=1 Tax=BD1-7 clade bacterium TaxID=2029982 RepID=A0A5S9MTF0_9GAMM|nr:Putative cation/proton antiporter YbaL [BD1-7 clade bacterium]CAA0084061.1 Putative cation/proton antiporter YbaL [BD1-7 clade bacterium]
MIDPLIILVAFGCGLLLKRLDQPPLIGYLLAGFVLHAMGFGHTTFIDQLANTGVLLLLFTIGLKLKLRSLAAPHVWGVTAVHMLLLMPFLALLLWVGRLAIPGLPPLADTAMWMLAFGLSFSSTVFAVKIFDEKGESNALYASIAIGILIVQDIIAVVFMTASTGKVPSPYSVLLLLVLPLRPMIDRFFRWCGHGELLTLAGLTLAFVGAGLFSALNLKADLGALLAGIWVANSSQKNELAKNLVGMKDIFLIGFFVSIGLSGLPTLPLVVLAIGLTLVAFVKPVMYFLLLVGMRLRARTAFISSLSLFNYSEFGLIVVALAVDAGWMDESWLVMTALALSLSYILASPFNKSAHLLYEKHCRRLVRFEKTSRLPEETPVDIEDARIVVLGMGRVGAGAYRRFSGETNGRLIGIEENLEKVVSLRAQGFNVVKADANDTDFWRHLPHDQIDLIMVSLTNHEENKAVVDLIKQSGYGGNLAAVARYPDELAELKAAGCIAFNLYAEAGHGFATHVLKEMS